MKPVSTKLLFDHCYGKYAVAAVNIFTMEQIHGLFGAASASNTPIIVQLTPVARNYAHPLMLIQMIKTAAEIYPNTIYAVHLDHGNEEHALDAIESGYSSVMIDASHEDFETNVLRTAKIVKAAHKRGVQVEAELGVLSGVEDELNVDEARAKYTDPNTAREFVERTGCDSLAIAIGTSHGAYKFSGGGKLRIDILKEIQHRLPGVPLVLHGASGIDKEMVSGINKNGGRILNNANGVSDDDLKKSIEYGICKVNIATDLRLLWTKVHRQFFYEHPEMYDPIIPGKSYMSSYKEFMIERFEVLGSKGKAEKIQLR